MTRNAFTALIAGVLALAAASSAIADPAQSKLAVDAAKDRGEVGEQADGYLGFVRPVGDAAVKAAVAEINAGRAQLYRQAAARNGVTPEAAGAAAFTQVVQSKLQAGEYYRTVDGAWVRK